jgi:hypothetical protein
MVQHVQIGTGNAAITLLQAITAQQLAVADSFDRANLISDILEYVCEPV